MCDCADDNESTKQLINTSITNHNDYAWKRYTSSTSLGIIIRSLKLFFELWISSVSEESFLIYFQLEQEAYVLRGLFEEHFSGRVNKNANEKETKTGDFLHQIRTSVSLKGKYYSGFVMCYIIFKDILGFLHSINIKFNLTHVVSTTMTHHPCHKD